MIYGCNDAHHEKLSAIVQDRANAKYTQNQADKVGWWWTTKSDLLL